jgi:hypothetical protein
MRKTILFTGDHFYVIKNDSFQATIDTDKQTSKQSQEPSDKCLLVVRSYGEKGGLFCEAYGHIKTWEGYMRTLDVNPNIDYPIISIHAFETKDIINGQVTLLHHKNNYYSQRYLIHYKKVTGKTAPVYRKTVVPEKTDPLAKEKFLASNVKSLTFDSKEKKEVKGVYYRLENDRANNYSILDTYSNSNGKGEGITISRTYFQSAFNIPASAMSPGTEVKLVLYNFGENACPVISSKTNKRAFYVGLKKIEHLFGSHFKKPKMGQGTIPIKVCKVIVNGRDYWPKKKG